MTTYPGSCHCGAIKIAFTSDKLPETMRVGRCACSFCRRHGARTSGDPAGSVEFRAAPGSLSRYRFGLGITNVNSLDIRDTFDPAPPLHVYDGEDEARRRARRRKFWMKTTVIA